MSTATPPSAPSPARDPERSAAGEEFGRAFKATMAAVRRLRGRESHHQPGGLSDAQFSALFCLRANDALSTGEIAEAAEVSPASATEMLEGLARAGLVARIRSERDRRVVLSSLTERGRELVEERHARMAPRFQAAMADFSPGELRTAASVLDAMRAMFEQLAQERSDADRAPEAQ